MELLVLDKNIQSIDVVDTFESLIWSDRFDEIGDFEIYMPISASVVATLQSGHYLWNSDSDHVMIVEEIGIKTDIDEGNKLIVTGRSLESLLLRRIVWSQTVLENVSLQDGIERLLNENIINPTIAERKIDNFVFKKSTDERILNLTLNAQYNGENLYDTIHALCIQNGIGFKITLDDSNRFVFELYVGADRTYDQLNNPFVIFSPNYDNILNSNYVESVADYKNVALVAGEGEGADRKTSTVGNVSGVERREMFVDASNITSKTDEKTLTPEQYDEQLAQKGTDELAVNGIKVAFDGEIEGTRMFKLGEDFFIGDLVQVENEYGHEGVAVVSEVIMSQNKEGIAMYPKFKMI